MAFVMMLVIPTTSFGDTIIIEPVEEVIKRSDLIIEASVVDIDYYPIERSSLGHAFITLEVDDFLKGESDTRIVTKRFGVDESGKQLFGKNTPVFELGDRVIVCLREEADGYYLHLGLYRGTFHVSENDVVKNYDMDINEFKSHIVNVVKGGIEEFPEPATDPYDVKNFDPSKKMKMGPDSHFYILSGHGSHLDGHFEAFDETWDLSYNPVQFHYNEDNVQISASTSTMLERINDAFDVWNELAHSELKFETITSSHLTSQGQVDNDVSVILWDDLPSHIIAREHPHPKEDGVGTKVGSDIVFNSNIDAMNWHVSPNPLNIRDDENIDFVDILIHELGHTQGLDHTSVSSTIMYGGGYENTDIFPTRTLADGDKAGAVYQHTVPELSGTVSHSVVLSHNRNIITIPKGSELNLHADLKVNEGVTLDIEQDMTVNFLDDDLKIDVDGTFTAIGTSSERIAFNANGNSNLEILANNGATIRQTDVDGIDVTVSGSGQSAVIWDSRFLNAGFAVTLDGLSSVSFLRNHIDDASFAGLHLVNFQGSNTIGRNSITNATQNGIRLNNSEIDDFYMNVVEDGSNRGIQLIFGSDGFLTDFDEQEEGKNRFKNMGGTHIEVSSNSLAFLGDSEYVSKNAVYSTDQEFSDEYVWNANTSATVYAHHTYWGTTSAPSSSLFDGLVDYSNHETSDDTGSSGSPLAKSVSPGSQPTEEQRKERLHELISELDEDAWRNGNDRRLSELYMYMRMDRNDKMDLRDQILATIAEWSSRRSVLTSDYGDSPEVRQAVETAMLLEIRLAFRDSDYEQADRLNATMEPYIQLTENRVALLENEVSLNIHYRDYAGALQALDQVRTLADGESFQDEQSLDIMEYYLTRRLGDGEEGSGREGKMASDDAQEMQEPKPESYALKANYPNPFNPVTVIPFALPDAGQVLIEVYDILGRRVAVLTDQTYEAGRHQVSWDGTRAASGIYIIRMLVTEQDNHRHEFHRNVTLVK